MARSAMKKAEKMMRIFVIKIVVLF